MAATLFALLFVILRTLAAFASAEGTGNTGGILVVGSLNADTFLPVTRLPVEGENLTVLPGRTVEIDVPGGKGCNQAVACARLCAGANPVSFLGQFGNDAAATTLRKALTDAGINVSQCGTCADVPSGRGYVFLQEDSGKVSAVVVGGSNVEGWSDWKQESDTRITTEYIDSLLKDKSCVLLQREIPEYVNYAIAKRASALGVTILQDMGGEDRPMDEDMLRLCDYLIPNASELHRLCATLGEDLSTAYNRDGGTAHIVNCAHLLQKHGANNVLVTLGASGSVLVDKDGKTITVQPSCQLPSQSSVIDETGAGDCFRAAFAVARTEGKSIHEAMQFASAAQQMQHGSNHLLQSRQ